MIDPAEAAFPPEVWAEARRIASLHKADDTIRFNADLDLGTETFNVSLSMGDVLGRAARELAAKADAESVRMLKWMLRVVVRAEAKDDPKFDQRAQTHATFFLTQALSDYDQKETRAKPNQTVRNMEVRQRPPPVSTALCYTCREPTHVGEPCPAQCQKCNRCRQAGFGDCPDHSGVRP